MLAGVYRVWEHKSWLGMHVVGVRVLANGLVEHGMCLALHQGALPRRELLIGLRHLVPLVQAIRKKRTRVPLSLQWKAL